MKRSIKLHTLIISGILFMSSSGYTQNKKDNTLTDYDGNVYQSVTIGSQIWMKENLKTTKYNDGTAIPMVSDINKWSNLGTPAYCYNGDDETNNKTCNGVFYNWYAVKTGKLCPTGWHVPTDEEWTTLENYLGGSTVAGGKMKETGARHWKIPNTGATNESGFSALPGGPCGSDLSGYDGYWWSATDGYAAAWYRGLNHSTASISRTSASYRAGFSVRCLKDKLKN